MYMYLIYKNRNEMKIEKSTNILGECNTPLPVISRTSS